MNLPPAQRAFNKENSQILVLGLVYILSSSILLGVFFLSQSNLLNSSLESSLQLNSSIVSQSLGMIMILHTITITTVFLYLIWLFLKSKKQVEGLQTQLADKQEIISVAAHEIGAPLTNIKGTLSIIAKEAGLSGPSQTFIERALISVEELVTLIDGLLTISRFEMGKIKISKSQVNIEEVCLAILSELRPLADKEKMSLEFRKAKDCPATVLADPLRIREVFLNLVGNAIKYSSQGSVLITAENVAGNLRIAVSDNGPGIAPADLKLLFKRFVRLPATRDGRSGVGLGLYISRLITEAHGGKIWAESKVGSGTTFYFSLPLAN